MLADSKEIYNEITGYCDFADHLGEELKKDDTVSPQDKETILFPLIDELKDIGDKLIDQYVKHLKDKQNRQLIEELKETLQLILLKIDYCKNKVYELYRTKETE